jgi:hypothetical protein
MQGIYTYILETNYVPKEHSVAAILLFLLVVHTSLAPVLLLLLLALVIDGFSLQELVGNIPNQSKFKHTVLFHYLEKMNDARDNMDL